MMGRGADGGCGTEEKTRPLSRSTLPSPPAPSLDPFSQARKALSDRSPFDDPDEVGPRPRDLPAALAAFLPRHSDGRRKHKKSQGDSTPRKSSGHGLHSSAPQTIWDETEEYFRPLTLMDIDALALSLAFDPGTNDPCLSIPVPVSKSRIFDVRAAEVSLSSAPVAAEQQVKQELAEVEQAKKDSEVEQAKKAGELEVEQAKKAGELEVEQAKKDAEVEQAKKAGELEMEQAKKDGELEMEDQQVRKAEELETVEEEALAMEIDEPGMGSDSLAEAEQDESLLVNWLFNSRHRFLLTSERPNKKRKLLGRDAGLDQLLRLPYPESVDSQLLCDACFLGPTGLKWNRFIHCHSCKVLVHQRCYGMREVPAGPWLCSWCRYLEASEKLVKEGSRPCVLCPREDGALKPIRRDAGRKWNGSVPMEFAHLFCSLWTPEVYVEDTGAMEPVLNIGEVHETRTKLVCYLCKVKHGVCVRCSHGTCRTSFHPLCARESKHRMEIWGKFGCENVELRAFCSKHSSSPDINISKQSESFGGNVADCYSLIKPPLGILETNKLLKSRFSHSNRDKSLMQDEVMCSIEMDSNGNTPKLDTLPARLDHEDGDAQLYKSIDNNGVIGSGNNITSSPDVALILKKLIDRGKIRVDDVASELGISSTSLEAALLGETTSFSPGLRLKIIKWLQDSMHIWKFISDSTVSSVDRIETANGINAEVTGPVVPDDFKFAGGTPDTAVVKSLSPRTRRKSSAKILKDNRTKCQAVETLVQQNGNGKLVDENSEIPVVLAEDIKGDVNDENSSFHEPFGCFEGKELSETILEGTANPTDSNPSLKLPQGHNGNPSKMEIGNLMAAPHEPVSMTERVSSFESSIDQADEANTTVLTTLEKACGEDPDCDVDPVVMEGKNLIVDQSCSSYVHPLIRSKLMQVQSNPISNKKYGGTTSYDHSETVACLVDADTASSVYCDQLRQFSCTYISHVSGMTKMDQLSKAKSMGFLKLSPEDEVEGEMLYLQTRLLDKSVAIKHSCGDLIHRVVGKIPQELDALNKRRWDLILVTQFLREVREAKKRGRKERKHKEAQAVLAAAAAAAAASSRNSSLRKDANDEAMPNQHENPLRVSAVSGRPKASSSLVPRYKDSRSGVMMSSDKPPSGIFQIPNLSQESALYCDICKRAETLLNRIFSCSSCKVPVHLDCYRKLKNPIGAWTCELCEDMASKSSPGNGIVDGSEETCSDSYCGLCGGSTGAFRKSTDGKWVHALCAEWLLESKYRRGQQHSVEGVDAILKERSAYSCFLCLRSVGVCLKCSYGHCQVTFHPSCARMAGLYMNVKASGGRLQHKAYCEKHSLEQREADNQQHGAEELRTIKQIRVELEKVRLLCERIIKREKLKRDLVLCSHDILASRRDYVAFSVLVRSSFFPPGASSESATTSINDKSYSGTIQRSDDVTVDSTASGRRIGRPPLHMDTDRMTDDSSTSQLSFKRKFSDRDHVAGKQLPQRHASVVFRKYGEKRSKAIKHTETFQKELVMTSDQASMQNQRLPKGFAYVPLGCLSKEKPSIHDKESHEPREPGG